jgi:hypothetical protein
METGRGQYRDCRCLLVKTNQSNLPSLTPSHWLGLLCNIWSRMMWKDDNIIRCFFELCCGFSIYNCDQRNWYLILGRFFSQHSCLLLWAHQGKSPGRAGEILRYNISWKFYPIYLHYSGTK